MKFRAACFLALLPATCAIARADTFATFSFHYTGSSATAFSFTLPETPTGYSQDMYNQTFTTTPCGPVQLGTLQIQSCVDFSDNGFMFNGNDDIVRGAHVFTGPVTALSFLPGEYAVTFQNTFPFNGLAYGAPQDGILTISETPEPSSIALLGTGLLGALGVARRRFV